MCFRGGGHEFGDIISHTPGRKIMFSNWLQGGGGIRFMLGGSPEIWYTSKIFRFLDLESSLRHLWVTILFHVVPICMIASCIAAKLCINSVVHGLTKARID